ncbi:MAG: hypothetical protein ACXVCP_17310 [Bdellovibrio sp.]
MRFRTLKRGNLYFRLGLGTLIVASGFQNCSKIKISDIPQAASSSVDANNTNNANNINLPNQNFKLNIADSPNFVCSPFGDTAVPTDKSGLKTELRYINPASSLTSDQKNQILSVEYFDDQNADMIKAPATIYLPEVNVPTREFSAGFTGADGNPLKDNTGQVLIEYFGLKMESLLKLGPDDKEGYYELSTVSDDGTVLQILENGQWINLISNDGAHSTRMGCAPGHKIYLNKEARIPIRLYYNQGPRYKIANVLMWNYRGPLDTTDSSLPSDGTIQTYCGKSSSDAFWDSNSQPSTWIQDAFSEGWAILKPVNFELPNNEVNPCAYSSAPVTSSISAESVSGTNQSIHLNSSDSAVLMARLYQIQKDSSRVLVKTISLPEAFSHSFETDSLDPNSNYQLEITLEIPSKNIRVLKVYSLSLVAVAP